MSRKILVFSSIMVVCSVAFYTGCGPAIDLTMKFSTEGDNTYLATAEVIKDYKFEQPSAGKLKEDQSGTKIEVKFTQAVENVDELGNAIANVTLKEIKYVWKDKDSVKFDFDSSREADKSKPFAKLTGQSYKIKITPQGSISVVDAKKIRGLIKSGFEANIAKSFLDDLSIQKRHEILSLPDKGKTTLAKGDSWSRIKASPPGLLAPKSFEKVYTLENVENKNGKQIAVVQMNATESAIPADDAPKQSSGMGPFAKMFDTNEEYTGQMLFDTESGMINEYKEKLVTTYLAAEPSANQKPDKGPDTLTMRFTYSVSLSIVE